MQQALVHLHPLPEGGLAASRLFVPRAVPVDAAHDFLGPIKPDAICADIAAGAICPFSHKRFVMLNCEGVAHAVLEGDVGCATTGVQPPRRDTAPAAVLGQQNVGQLHAFLQGTLRTAVVCVDEGLPLYAQPCLQD